MEQTPSSTMLVASATNTTLQQLDEPDHFAHMFERKRNLSAAQTRLYKQFSESYCISLVLTYLGQRQGVKLQ